MFVAVTVNVYATPLVRPSTVQVSEEVVQVLPPGLAVTVYPRIGRPPVAIGAFHTTNAPLAPEVAVTLVGAPGTAAGVADAEGAEAAPLPAPFVAVTVKVYLMPLVRPLTVHDVVELVQVLPPGLDVTVYSVIELPPSDAGTDHETNDCPSSFDEADTPVGAPGFMAGVAGADASDTAPVPAMVVAVTVNV
jgi:hypothetical protein